ncbi:MAG: late competence development ComFB family protein [Defluviitaleaceae bacterium]|nr:late competence development ComFB family protein [Defluviitaleaceae bacterium]MCL2262191.1 late competence development ComFB family protein [Defluviitaleaceae bacterium]
MSFVMENYMEEILREKMPGILDSMPEICRCERCDTDRLAYALNNITPKYIATPKGKLYTKLQTLEGQFDTDIVRAITDAAVRVDQFPRHDEEEN